MISYNQLVESIIKYEFGYSSYNQPVSYNTFFYNDTKSSSIRVPLNILRGVKGSENSFCEYVSPNNYFWRKK